MYLIGVFPGCASGKEHACQYRRWKKKKKKKKRKQKTIQRILTEKDRVKLSLFADDIKLYIKSRGDDL